MLSRGLVALAVWLSVASSGLACWGAGARGDGRASGGATASGGAGASGGGGAGDGGGATHAGAGGCQAGVTASDGGFDTDAVAACAACELASSAPGCDPGLLSAATDPEGNALGWGVDSLPTEPARAAGVALLRCVNAHTCATNADNDGPGDNAVLGCFCGAGVTVEDCISGAGVHGSCVAEYEAAATATPTGPAACSSLAAYASFIAMVSSNWRSPIGIVDNVVRCAVNAPCAVCSGL